MVDFLISIHQYSQEAFFQASKYFYFNSPKEKFSKKTPKNAKNLDKILRGGCAKSDEEKFGDFLKAFSKKGTAVESIEIAPGICSIKKSLLSRFSRFSKKGTAVESIEIAPSYSSIQK